MGGAWAGLVGTGPGRSGAEGRPALRLGVLCPARGPSVKDRCRVPALCQGEFPTLYVY